MCSSGSNVILCSSGQGISKKHVTASWSDEYSRKVHPGIDPHIDEIWTLRTNENPYLYNASKFRLSDVRVQYSSNEKLPYVHFLLGSTTYKEFIGTNCSPYAIEVVKYCDLPASSVNIQEYMADPLGVGSLLETSDHKFVFIKRSQTCGEAQGMIDRPGGHPEPEALRFLNKPGRLTCFASRSLSLFIRWNEESKSLVITERLIHRSHFVCEPETKPRHTMSTVVKDESFLSGKDSTASINIKLKCLKEVDDHEAVSSDVVVEEIFSSVQCEIRDELNIPIEKLGESFLLGIVYNKETIGRPSLEFYTRCLLTSKEVHAEYMKQTQPEKEESVELIIISASELLSLCHLQNDPFWFQLTTAAQGAMIMFSMCHSYHMS